MKTGCLLPAVLEPGGLSTRLQPIFEVSSRGQRLHAVEALTRGPKGTILEPAGVLFEYVRRKRQEAAVDRACVRTILDAVRDLPPDVDVSLNVHASTLGSERDFAGFLLETAATNSVAPSRLILEVVEQTPSWDRPNLISCLNLLRENEVRIALDDLGSGHSHYRMLLDCKPDYVKVDSSIVVGCVSDPYRRAVLDSILHLGREFGAQPVIEGVDRYADLEVLLAMGFTLIQCYLLAAPMTVDELQACEWFAGRSGYVRPSLLLREMAASRKMPASANPLAPALLQLEFGG
ncbi:MAG TPA: EAL domain-containing protein [Terriglobales bacterium]|nr:EAL domain-containing protein [Terriglobales bacterium]